MLQQPFMQSPSPQQGHYQGISPLLNQQLANAMQSPHGRFDSLEFANLVDGQVQSAMHNLMSLQPGFGGFMGPSYAATMQPQIMHAGPRTLPYFGSPNPVARRRRARDEAVNYYAPFGTNNPDEYYFD